MLSINDITSLLEPNQKLIDITSLLEPNQKLIDNVSEKVDIENNKNSMIYELDKLMHRYNHESRSDSDSYINDIVCMSGDSESYSILDINDSYKSHYQNTFLDGVLYCMVSSYRLLSRVHKVEYRKEFLKIIGYRLENHDLHRKFGYSKLRKFKKSLMLTDIFNHNYNMDIDLNNVIKKYLVDFFDINILVFNLEDNIIDTIYSTVTNKIFIKYKPTLLLVKRNINGSTVYVSLIDDNNENSFYVYRYSTCKLVKYICDNLINNL
jgi:hypothetical protein